jgi:hypothetical protein
MSLSANQRQLALLELGIERAPLWRPHPSLRLVVTRKSIDSGELRVLFNTQGARAAFLREQRTARQSVRPESRKHFERSLGVDEE